VTSYHRWPYGSVFLVRQLDLIKEERFVSVVSVIDQCREWNKRRM